MKRLHVIVIAAAGLGILLLLASISQEVETGRLVTCKHCQKKILDDKRVIKVPWWKAGGYAVAWTKEYCKDCGDELVQYNESICCERCGKQYATEAKSAPRRLEKQDPLIKNAFCDYCKQPVEYRERVHCNRCGAVYGETTKTAPRSEDPKDVDVTRGYCSKGCEDVASVAKTAENVGAGAGAVIKKLQKGFTEEIKK